MEYDLFEILNISRTTKIPSIIVEGRDDIQFYSGLSSSIDKEIEVFAIENIEGYSEGCYFLIQAFQNLADTIDARIEYDRFILGIIDRDARTFRNELPSDLKGLFVLKYYSFESHFATETTIKKLISNITYTSGSLLQSPLAIEIVKKEVKQREKPLYYCSLEALKNACEIDYNNLLGYDNTVGQILNDDKLIEKVLNKQDELDEYANLRALSNNDIKLIAKGKWLLEWFIKNVLEEIKKLPNLCKNNTVKKCQYCKINKFDQCLYKIKKSKLTVKPASLKDDILQEYDEPELSYIKERIKQLN